MVNSACSWVHKALLAVVTNQQISDKDPLVGISFFQNRSQSRNFVLNILNGARKKKWHRWLNLTSKCSKMFTWLSMPLTSANFSCHIHVYPSYCKQELVFTNASSLNKYLSLHRNIRVHFVYVNTFIVCPPTVDISLTLWNTYTTHTRSFVTLCKTM